MKTCAERCKSYREKVKSNKELSEIVRVKNAERMRTYRKNLKNKLKENKAIIENVKTYNRNRMQSYRNKLKKKTQKTQNIQLHHQTMDTSARIPFTKQ